MKKILIVSHGLELGGAETALLGLLETIDTNKYQVDLFLLRHGGALMRYVPKTVRLLPEAPQYASLAVPVADVIMHGQFGVAAGRALGKCLAKRRVRQLRLPTDNAVALEYSHKYTVRFMPKIQPKVEYDLAVSFLTPHYFAARKVRAKKKIAWIHTDYATVGVDAASEEAMWSQFDRIVSISEQVTKSFLKTFPRLEQRMICMENIMPMVYMQQLTEGVSAEREMPRDGAFRLLTIGRFSHAKRMDEIPLICKRIRERGCNVKWYLIGFGGEEELTRRNIAEAGMQDFVVILGKKENPYPYLKACDLYVQPSRYEGKSVAVREAQILHKPVVITNYATAGSQLQDGFDGVIVPMDVEGCARGIAAGVQNETLRRKLIENTAKQDYTNAGEIQKLYDVMEL